VIAPVALSADALVEDCGHGTDRLADLHRRLTETLIAHGQIVFADAAAEAYFHQQLQILAQRSPSAGKLWEGLLQFGRFVYANGDATPLEQIDTFAVLVDDWAQLVETAIVEPDRAVLLGCPEGHGAWLDPQSGLEVACHDCIGASRVLGGLRRLESRRTIRIGVDREALWDQRIGPLARSAQTIHVQDRFLGTSLDAWYQACDRVAARGKRIRQAPNEVEWLLDRLATDGKDLAVSFYTQYPDDWPTPAPVVRAFERAVAASRAKGRGVVKVQLFVLSERQWDPHDRHLRADGAGVEVSAGFDRLREPLIAAGFTMTYLYADDVQKLKDEENEVRRRLAGRPLQLL
jgi:hypothetical protein